MLRCPFLLAMAGFAAVAHADQFEFDWSKDVPGQPPPNFISLVTGPGRPADWTIREEDVPSVLAPLYAASNQPTAKHSVLSVHSFDLNEAHMPILLFTNEIFTDFTFTTRFKIVGGVVQPMAGVIFRAQDPNNYYVVRASAEGNLLWYRVVNGEAFQSLGIGVRLPMPKDQWRELRIECKGNAIRCFLDGKLVIPPAKPGAPTDNLAINDTTFASGKVGFCTAADSQCCFTDSRVVYTPKVPYVQIVIAQVAERFQPLELLVYADKTPGAPTLIATAHHQSLGQPGDKYEQDVIDRGSIYYQKFPGAVEVTLPLRDRNGDVAAAIKTRMKSFPGETQKTAVERAAVIKNAMEAQLDKLQSLTE